MIHFRKGIFKLGQVALDGPMQSVHEAMITLLTRCVSSVHQIVIEEDLFVDRPSGSRTLSEIRKKALHSYEELFTRNYAASHRAAALHLGVCKLDFPHGDT